MMLCCILNYFKNILPVQYFQYIQTNFLVKSVFDTTPARVITHPRLTVVILWQYWPVRPGDPGLPLGPAPPGAPVGPFSPRDPGCPLGPTRPGNPLGPVAPVNPVAPGGPGGPEIFHRRRLWCIFHQLKHAMNVKASSNDFRNYFNPFVCLTNRSDTCTLCCGSLCRIHRSSRSRRTRLSRHSCCTCSNTGNFAGTYIVTIITVINQSINQSDDKRRLRWASMSVSVLKTAYHFNNNFHYHTQIDRRFRLIQQGNHI